MWSRQDLKSRGKVAFKANYWRAVLVALIASFVTGGMAAPNAYFQFKNQTQNRYGGGTTLDGSTIYSPENAVNIAAILSVVLIILTFIILFSVLLNVFVFSPLQVGCNKFFLINREDPQANVNLVGSSFGPNYKNIVKTMFFMNLYVFLWSLLFVIPGIIKSYQYRLVPYLIAENPAMDYKEALEISTQRMYGQKMDAFVLDLSFIGWSLLAAITLNIVGIFYVMPYVYATNAELYVALVHGRDTHDPYREAEDSSTVEFIVD